MIEEEASVGMFSLPKTILFMKVKEEELLFSMEGKTRRIPHPLKASIDAFDKRADVGGKKEKKKKEHLWKKARTWKKRRRGRRERGNRTPLKASTDGTFIKKKQQYQF